MPQLIKMQSGGAVRVDTLTAPPTPKAQGPVEEEPDGLGSRRICWEIVPPRNVTSQGSACLNRNRATPKDLPAHTKFSS